ncbi:MAG TPA: GDSL-type esterase/lipase family protein [Stellaceae bacterium]|nr:GDSL-type esterase/lipase family protein [Stellaceae bacterium]
MRGEQAAARAAIFVAALVALIAGQAAVAAEPVTQPEVPRLFNAAALQPFFAALAGLDQPGATRQLRILQIGDSHTANDAFSGDMRERLQARFGASGRGWLPAGIPFKYYRPALVSVEENGWRHVHAGEGEAAARLGLDAVVAQAEHPDASMRLTSQEPLGFDRFAIEFIAQPHGAPLTVRFDGGAVRTVTTEAAITAHRRVEMLLPRAAHTVELTATDGVGQEVLGWAVERRQRGIIYENHGTIGATVALLNRMNPAVVAAELAERRPALLVVAFGTNEGFKDGLDRGEYAAQFRAAVTGLRQKAHGAAVLIVGSPDGNRLAKECNGAAAAAVGCRADPSDSGAACAWTEPRNLAAVRDIQRRIAAQQGWAFWDWSAAMGGACTMPQWVAADPPLAMPDHVHLSKAGYAATADMLFRDLMHADEDWKRTRRR